MTFSIYKSFQTLNHIKIHRCNDGKSCSDLNICLTIKEVSSTRYLGNIFDNNFPLESSHSKFGRKVTSGNL